MKYNINQLLFLIVDNDLDGRITEFSESCKKLLTGYGFGVSMEQNGIIKRISEVVQDFDFDLFKRGRQDRYRTNEMFENEVKLDLN